MPLGAKKNAIQNNMIQQYLYHGGHIQGHTHMTWKTRDWTFLSKFFYCTLMLDADPFQLEIALKIANEQLATPV